MRFLQRSGNTQILLAAARQLGTATLLGWLLSLFNLSIFAQDANVDSRGELVTTIHVDAAHPVKSFDPDIVLGTSIDILPQGMVDKVYAPAILKESLSAGWGPITYRQNTELQGGAWHWNP